ncbi:MAG: hypothetical protein ACR2Q4_05820 [Geminicoccaceae bacterium]
MRSLSTLVDPAATGDALDQLFLDCSELEALVTSIRQTIDGLSPAVDAGLVTAEHLLNLACRIEAAEQGLISVAHQIGNSASAVIEHRQRVASAH